MIIRFFIDPETDVQHIYNHNVAVEEVEEAPVPVAGQAQDTGQRQKRVGGCQKRHGGSSILELDPTVVGGLTHPQDDPTVLDGVTHPVDGRTQPVDGLTHP